MPDNPRIEELRRRVQADPASIAFAALAEEFRRMGRYDDAIKTCRTGLVRHPSYLSARVTLGRALIETGDYDAAREELQTVLRSAPENIAATKGLADITERLGQSAGMHPDISAIANKPPDPVVDLQLPSLQPAAPMNLAAFDLPLAAPPAPGPAHQNPDEAFDIFEAALQRTLAGKAPAVPEPPPIAFEAVTIAFEAPVMPVMPAEPDPHVAATLMRLERFLGAIQTARRA